MGLPKQVLKLILCEHAQRPIHGNILMMGRQTLSVTESELREYMDELGIKAREVEVKCGQETRGSSQRSIEDKSFFSLFTDAKYSALDLTAYEGADVIHDMNTPVPDSLRGKFDFIYDGGCMDNLFDPRQFIVNTSDLLAPGGRMIHLEFGSMGRGAYLMYSGDWFHDYYALNKFEDCKVFYARYQNDLWNERWAISQLRPFRGNKTERLRGKTWVLSPWPHLVMVVVEKSAQSTSHKTPVQHNYRPHDEDYKIYETSSRRFVQSDRYPSGFGRPTFHKSTPLKFLSAAIKRATWKTRSNLSYCQML